MRTQELMPHIIPSHPAQAGDTERFAGLRLLETYVGLAERRKHLLFDVLGGQMLRQWHHYPEDDAIDRDHGYQWFYHSHSPEDRRGSMEHGHFHLFARKACWVRGHNSTRERAFRLLTGRSWEPVHTRHLLGIGLSAKGVPASLFTVNSWVTGDMMLSADSTAALLRQMRLHTGYEAIDTVIECVISLCRCEIDRLLAERDRVLFSRKSANVLTDRSLEVLSETAIDLEAILQRARTS